MGASSLPIGVTFADLEAMSKEATPLYPPLDPMPVLSALSDTEREMCRLQVAVATRLRTSAYYTVEERKADELERYSDRFKPTARTRPTLQQDYLNKEFFPATLWEAHFNPRKRVAALAGPSRPKKKKLKVDWSALGVEGAGDGTGENNDEEEEGEGGVGDEEGAIEEDYDEENEDNDYELNYFDNGEEDNDDLGDGGGDGEGGGEDAYD